MMSEATLAEIRKSYSERLKEAQAAVFPNEELKEQNFNSVNTEGFEKIVVGLKHWIEMTLRAIQEHKSFRIEIKYNAEAAKTDFCIYTPTKDEKGGTK